jgi:uracil-DNA glycosylase
MDYLNIESTHPEWHDLLTNALHEIHPEYRKQLQFEHSWLPGPKQLFAAFRQPLSATRFILLGESPYPRVQSANGYAFWDANVGSLWSSSGLSKEVNRATSLRNMLKMLLHARGDLKNDFSQEAIALLDKTNLISTASQLFTAFIQRGFLLLNASLVYSEGKVPYHARQWQPFMHYLLNQLADSHPNLRLILFGKIAANIPESVRFQRLTAEHPYNISFITNSQVLDFFKPLDLLTL